MLLVLVLVLAASGCSQKEDAMDVREQAEERASAARSHIDSLADRLGTQREVLQDEIGDCVPGQSDSGLDLSYVVRVVFDDAPQDSTVEEIISQLVDDGWSAERGRAAAGNEMQIRFRKAPFVMTAMIRNSDGEATVVGSGGCVQ